jgi:bacillithiol biosynthesis cysteine-adding enzyme BshC
MKVSSFPPQSLPPLIADYVQHNDKLAQFSDGFISLKTVLEKAQSREFSDRQRSSLTSVLLKQYQGVECSEETLQNLELLKKSETFTITTGHQLCLLTGPLYFIYKIVSTIRLSQDLAAADPSKRFVPVYWLASEDHDIAEINHVYWRGNKHQWTSNQVGPVGQLKTEGLISWIHDLFQSLGNSSNVSFIKKLVEKAYSETTLTGATRLLVNGLFGRYGIVVVDGNEVEFKEGFSDLIKRELVDQVVFKNVTTTNEKLRELGYQPAVNPREIGLFYISPNMRERIILENGRYHINNTELSFSREELLIELETHPEKFSPNVLFRPLFQEFILPNVAYIGGPGELCYWMQTKSTFDEFKVPYPSLILRDQAMIIGLNVKKKLEKIGLLPTIVFGDKEKFIKDFVEKNATTNVEEESAELLGKMDALALRLSAVDKTLEASVQAEKQKLSKGLENIAGKLLRSEKQRMELSVSQIEFVFNALKPGGILQERIDNFFQFQSDIEDDIIEELLMYFNPLEPSMKIFTTE